MDNLVWNYDLTQCPWDVVLNFKPANFHSHPIIGVRGRNSAPEGRLYVYAENNNNHQLAVAWAPYTPPKEPEVWIKHDGKSWPQCNPLDLLKVQFEDGCQETIRADSYAWGWAKQNMAVPILNYCVIERAE